MKQVLFLLLFPLYLWSQPPAATLHRGEALSIGAYVPDLTLTSVLNHPDGKLSLSQFQGKLLVIDFMATYCLSCLQILPRLDSLQQQFGDQLQILLVTAEEKEKVAAFLQKTSVGKKIRLPLVTGDTALAQLFPHRFLSHDVWIDGSGQVKAITASDYVDRANIQAVLKGEAINWPVKRDLYYDYSQPLFTLNEESGPPETRPASHYYNAFTSYRPGIASRYSSGTADSSRGTLKVSMINLGPLDMLKRAWKIPVQFPLSQVVMEVRDPSRLFYQSGLQYREEWNLQHAYCFEAVLPLHLSAAQQWQKLRADLDYFLGVKSRYEKRKVPCLVISGKGGPVQGAHAKEAPVSLSDLVWQWNQLPGRLPLIDESGQGKKQFVTSGLDGTISRAALEGELKKHGLQLQPAIRELPVLVLTDASR